MFLILKKKNNKKIKLSKNIYIKKKTYIKQCVDFITSLRELFNMLKDIFCYRICSNKRNFTCHICEVIL